MKKRNILLFTTAALTMATMMTVGVLATGWQQKEEGWRYNTNIESSAWCHNGWYWVDGNSDGVAECYYFNENGYALTNTTTPDGYTVNADGAWTENGVVQTKQVEKGYVSGNLTDAAKIAATHPVIDASTIDKITLKSGVDAICTNSYNDFTLDPLPNKTYYETVGATDRYTTVVDGSTLYANYINYPEYSHALFLGLTGYAKDFFNNIPEQGILVTAFYDSFGHPGISSQSQQKIVFGMDAHIFHPVVSYSGGVHTLETVVNNAEIYILATEGEGVSTGKYYSKYYVYPDSPTVAYGSVSSSFSSKLSFK